MIRYENKTIEILGDIGAGWFNEGITAKSISDQLVGVEDEISLVVGSLGGDVSDALGIYAMLRSHKGGVSGKIIGMTASSGTITAMAVEKGKLSMDSTALFLIHNASTDTFGNADRMEKTAEDLRKIDQQIAGIYANRTGHTPEEMLDLMKQERWLNATEALDWGFVDSIYKGTEAQNIANQSRATALLPLYKNKPTKNQITNTMTEEEITQLQTEKDALQTKVDELTAKLAEYEQKEIEAKAAEEEQQIEAACEEKKMDAAAKANFKLLAKADFKNTLATIKAMPVRSQSALDLINSGTAQSNEALMAKYAQMKKANKLQAWSQSNPEEYKAAVAIRFNR